MSKLSEISRNQKRCSQIVNNDIMTFALPFYLIFILWVRTPGYNLEGVVNIYIYIWKVHSRWKVLCVFPVGMGGYCWYLKPTNLLNCEKTGGEHKFMRVRGEGKVHIIYTNIRISTFPWSICAIIERYRVHSLRQGKNGLQRIMSLTKFFI
jgi:hypothetical protein